MNQVYSHKKLNQNQNKQKKLNTWNTIDQSNLDPPGIRDSPDFINNPNSENNCYINNLNNHNNQYKPCISFNFLKENFSFFTAEENYTKITSTNKIQNANLPYDYLIGCEADIKEESRKIRKNFNWRTFESFLKFFTKGFEEIGFYVFTKKIIKSFKFIFAFCENNVEKEISQCDSNVNNLYMSFLSLATKNEYFGFVLKKEFGLSAWEQIAVKIQALESKRNEIFDYFLKQKKRIKNRKTNERNQRNQMNYNNMVKIGGGDEEIDIISRKNIYRNCNVPYTSKYFFNNLFSKNFLFIN